MTRTRLAAGVAVLLVAAGVVVAATDPFASGSPSAGGASENGTGTATQTVVRRNLTSQTQVDGTLGYADASSVSLPAGTAPSSVLQAEQALAAARQSLAGAQATLASDSRALAQAQAQLTADRLSERANCGGSAAADPAGGGSPSNNGTNGTNGGGGSPSGSGSTPCGTAAQAVTGAQQAVATASAKVTADQGQVSSAQTSVSGAGQSLAAAQSSAVVYDAGASYTMLPQAGEIIRRGRPLYAVSGRPALLLYGPVTAWRAFRPGMSPGRDVAELNANLDALGYAHEAAGESFTAATEQGIRALQRAHGLAQNGVLPLGSIVFSSGPVRVASVTPTVGQAVQAGPVLSITSTRHEVAIQLDAAQQSQIEVGDRVVVTLPDDSTTPGVVSDVGKVATVPSSDESNGGPSTPTIEVDVRLLHEGAAGSLDQAPVSVAITTAGVDHVLTVPVNALLALASGGYAVEVVGAGGVHRLVAVSAGPIFDDADGLVEVSGAGLRAGQRVVVPSE